MQRYVKDDIVVSEADIQKGFEAKFGPKSDCRIIVVKSEQAQQKDAIWAKAKACKSVEEFERLATEQPIAQFASVAGKIDPIHKHLGDPNIEDYAFKLKPGETSPLIPIPDGFVILYCVKHIEADPEKTISKVRDIIFRETFEAKVSAAIPEAFKKIREAATPQLFIRPEPMSLPSPGLTTGMPYMASHRRRLRRRRRSRPKPRARRRQRSPSLARLLQRHLKRRLGGYSLPGILPPSEPPAPPTGVFPNRAKGLPDKSE